MVVVALALFLYLKPTKTVIVNDSAYDALKLENSELLQTIGAERREIEQLKLTLDEIPQYFERLRVNSDSNDKYKDSIRATIFARFDLLRR